MRGVYRGENLTDEEASKKGLSPRRHALPARQDIEALVKKTQANQDILIAMLQQMAARGQGATPEYAARLKAAHAQRTGELFFAKRLKDLGLMGSEKELEAYKVRYLETDAERQPYLVTKGPSGLVQGVPPAVFDTTRLTSYGSGAGWAAYVMDPTGKLYAAEHRIQRFHHSSFTAGSDVAAAGEIRAVNGQLKGISNKTGHYHAGEEHVANVLKELREMGVNLSGVETWLVSANDALTRQTDDAATWLAKYLQRAGGNPTSVGTLTA
jgi:hypothetical protein